MLVFVAFLVRLRPSVLALMLLNEVRLFFLSVAKTNFVDQIDISNSSFELITGAILGWINRVTL